MLDQWLSSLSKTALATIGILGGIALILVIKPPHSKCDTQEESFRKGISKYYFIEYKKREIIKKNRFTMSLDECRYDGGPGACYDFFENLRKLNRELVGVSNECLGGVAKIKEIRSALMDGVELLVRLAWGESAPETYAERKGWLGESEVALFCQLKSQIVKAFGNEKWKSFREKQFTKLPGAEKLSRNEIWSRMLFSVKCQYF